MNYEFRITQKAEIFEFFRVRAAKRQELQAAQETVNEVAQAVGDDVRASPDVRAARSRRARAVRTRSRQLLL